MKSSLTNNMFDYAGLYTFSGFTLNMTRFSSFRVREYRPVYLAFHPPSIEIILPVSESHLNLFMKFDKTKHKKLMKAMDHI